MRNNSEAKKAHGSMASALLRVLLAASLCFGIAAPFDGGIAQAAEPQKGRVGIQADESDQSEPADDKADGEGSGGGNSEGEQESGDGGGAGSGDSGSSGRGGGAATGGGSSGSSGASEDKGGGGSASDEPAEPAEPAAPTLAGLYLFYQNYDKPTKPLAYNPTADPLIAKDKGTMELYAQSEFTNGNIGWVADSGVGVVWSIQKTLDENGAEQAKQIAEVDRAEGIVRALGQGNGKVVVRCQAQNYDVHADITITIKGNAGVPYLTDLQICDEAGKPYDNDAEIRIESDDFGLEKKFNLRATYHDPATDKDVVRETVKGDVVEGASWTVSGDSKVSYVNPDTGVFIAQATGSVRLTCSVAGSGLLGDTLSDYVFVLCGGDTLDPDRDYSPADELKVVVKYATEDKQGIGGEDDYENFRTWYYSPSELEALGVTENLYTLVKSSGSWGTMKAHGVYLERLVSDVINSDDFTIDQVKGFYFGATDDYNPGFVGEAWLFETQRYYYPNMSIGSGNLGAVAVAPMIATQTVQEDLIDEPAGELSEQTRFRLCLGAESTTVNNAQQSIYNIYKITVVLNGAPPVGSDEPGGGHRDSLSGGGSTGGAGGDGGSSGEGGGTEGGSEPGGAAGPGATVPGGDVQGSSEGGSDASDGQQASSPSASSDTAGQQESPQVESAAGGQQAAQSESAQSEATGQAAPMRAEPTGETARAIEDMVGDAQHRYQVYEMMSAQPALLEALDLENPLAPFVAPGLALVALSGGLYSYVWFRRQTAPIGAPSLLRGATAALMSMLAR